MAHSPFRIALLLAWGLIPRSAWCQDPGTPSLPDSLMDPGTKVIWVKQVAAYCEGPAVSRDGILYFTQQGTSLNIWKIDPAAPGDTGAVFLANSELANGMEFDNQDRLVAAQIGKVTRFEKDGRQTVLVRTGANGVNFGQANDLSMASNGAFYFTDLGNNVYYADSTGRLKVAYAAAKGANGVQWVEETSQVYINEANGGQVTRLQAGAAGSLGNPQRFAGVNVPDGVTMDAHGNFYFASYGDGAVIVVNAAGTQVGKIVLSPVDRKWNVTSGAAGNVSNCAFGGPDRKTLYITGDGGAYSIRLKIAGRLRPGASSAAGGRPAASPWEVRLSGHAFDPALAPLTISLSHPDLLIRIYDLRFREVWRRTPAPAGARGAALTALEWHGTGSGGARLASGRYYLTASRGGHTRAIGPVDLAKGRLP